MKNIQYSMFFSHRLFNLKKKLFVKHYFYENIYVINEGRF